MKQKKLTKTFMMISNRKKPFGLHGLYQNIPELSGFRMSYNLFKSCHFSAASEINYFDTNRFIFDDHLLFQKH